MRELFEVSLNKEFVEVLKATDEKILEIEGLDKDSLDTCKFIKRFMKQDNTANGSIDDNANISSKNICNLLEESGKPFQKLLSYNKLFCQLKKDWGIETAKEFLTKALNGRLYLHDSHNASFLPYCYAFSLETIVKKGLFFISEMKGNPARHLDTFNHHVIELVSYGTRMLAGAVGLPDYFIYAYYFFKKDVEYYGFNEKQSEKYKKQQFQSLIFALNQPYLKGSQSAFTNLSLLDKAHLSKFTEAILYPDVTSPLDCLEEIQQFSLDFLTQAGEIRKEKWYTFPVISASIIHMDGKIEDKEFFKKIVEHNNKYFNEVNIMLAETPTSAASCCRLKSSITDIKANKFNSTGGSDLNIGSTKVVTINFNRYFLISETGDLKQVKLMLKEDIAIIKKFHYSHRKVLQENIDLGLLPLYTHGLMSLESQFGTIGINAFYELIDGLGGIGEDEFGAFYNDKGKELSKNILEFMKEKSNPEYGITYNIEQVPGESCSIKNCKKDKIIFGEQAVGEGNYIYSNQWIPLKQKSSPFYRIKASGTLDKYCGGGAILHLNLGEKFRYTEDAIDLIEKMAEQGVAYFSFIDKIGICKNGHSFTITKCPICEEKPEKYGVKVVGYLVSEDSFKSERAKEFSQREFYTIK